VTISQDILHHGPDYTPYEGLHVTGWPVTMLVRGEVVVADGAWSAARGPASIWRATLRSSPPPATNARRTVDLGHSSDGPSWIDLAEIRVTTTESRFAACLNRLLQQNL
jgi:hypothetical protein